MLLPTLAACGDYSNEYLKEDLEFLLAVPARAALEVRVADTTPRETELGGHQSGLSVRQDALLGDPAVFYLLTDTFSQEVNSGVFGTLDLVDQVTSLPPTRRKVNQRIWGPWWSLQNPHSDWRFVMTRDPQAGVFEIAMQVRELRPSNQLGPDDGWENCFYGTVEPSSGSVRRGKGSLTADAGVCSKFEGTGEQGLAGIGFDTSPDAGNPEGKTDLQIVFSDFVSKDMLERDPNPVPINATYTYLELGDFSGELFFDIWTDLENGDNPNRPAQEHVELVAQWNITGAGRTDSRWSDGDLGALVVLSQECWDTEYKRSYYHDTFNLLGPEEGNPQNCVLDPAEF
jgi:hypothetical protein